ncbi:XRE family transcriptional regulator [Amylibacter ulvae]|uniref:XRE family transcriptional regulator n=1 Tax=Paramylibacter ulvae TaxID=1651968 RepID=A0ABQ3CWR5_9RHOB|nr:XRE family transcriptional regulator [Amylibacter ulvae]GHA47692.1 XRE family transcriptional regulator [Amylibacter ulvae]
MAEQKVFAGPRIRRLRNSLGLSQTAMAKEIGISPSYLNLIERNQRPLTVQLLLKLSGQYDLNLEELKTDAGGAVPELKEVFADALLAGELPGTEELFEVAEAAPNAANGVIKLYRAYRESQERLTDLKDLLAQEGKLTSLDQARLPSDEFNEAVETRANYYPFTDEAAEAFAKEIGHGPLLLANLVNWFKREHGIAVQFVPSEVMPNLLRRFDKHTMRLFIADRLSSFDQVEQVAMEAAMIVLRDAIDEDMKRLNLKSAEAQRLARFHLARYGAQAIMMPYQAFWRVALRGKYEIDQLASRFAVSFSQAAHRATTLQRKDMEGLPFFFMETDHAGNVLRRGGAMGYPHTEFGGACPKLGVYAAFAQTRMTIKDNVEMPNGQQYITLSKAIKGPKLGLSERPRFTAFLLGLDAEFQDQTVFGSGNKVLVGPACRLCERSACLSRAEPPITRPLGLDEMVTGLSVFDFQ